MARGLRRGSFQQARRNTALRFVRLNFCGANHRLLASPGTGDQEVMQLKKM